MTPTILKCSIKNDGPELTVLEYSHKDKPTVRTEFTGSDRPSSECIMKSPKHQNPIPMTKNRIDAAFFVFEAIAKNKPENSEIHLTISLDDDDIKPRMFSSPLPDVTYLHTYGITNFVILNCLLHEVSAIPYKTLVIGGEEGSFFYGLAMCEKVQTAKSLTIDGFCDITDEQLAIFDCGQIILRSPYITAAGFRQHAEKLERMKRESGEAFQYDMICKIGGSSESAEALTAQIVPDGIRPNSYYVENGNGDVVYSGIEQNNSDASGEEGEGEAEADQPQEPQEPQEVDSVPSVGEGEDKEETKEEDKEDDFDVEKELIAINFLMTGKLGKEDDEKEEEKKADDN